MKNLRTQIWKGRLKFGRLLQNNPASGYFRKEYNKEAQGRKQKRIVIINHLQGVKSLSTRS